MIENSDENSGKNEILNYLKKIDQRISYIENRLNIKTDEAAKPAEENTAVPAVADSAKEDELEFRIGQLWFAKFGIIVLLLGLTLLLTLPLENLPGLLPSIAGYVIAGILLIAAKRNIESIKEISGYITGSAFVLMYFATLRLHFFSASPVVQNIGVELTILLIVVLITLILAVQKRSVYLVFLTLVFGYTTAILSDQIYFSLILVTVISGVFVYLKNKFQWEYLLLLGIFLTYIVHLNFFINNPFIGNELETSVDPRLNLLFILVCAFIFSLANIIRKDNIPEKFHQITASVLNTAGGFGLFFLITMISKPADFSLFHLLAAILFLSISFILWVKEKSKYSTFYYAMFGYLALSIAIIGQFEKPDFFIWLCWQSLLVISTAVYFRSRFIIVANFIIFIMIFIAFLIIGEVSGGVSLSFGIVALVSARILNWKKDQLELKTEQMRNAYLLTALLIIPYALYILVPAGFISISWIGVAILYYILSNLLKNKKYRWMSLLTFLLTAVYVIIVVITSSDLTYKIVSVMVLAVSLLLISLIYTRNKKKTGTNQTPVN
jgi:drug/metabolite transporter (DMT)-like permease